MDYLVRTEFDYGSTLHLSHTWIAPFAPASSVTVASVASIAPVASVAPTGSASSGALRDARSGPDFTRVYRKGRDIYEIGICLAILITAH